MITFSPSNAGTPVRTRAPLAPQSAYRWAWWVWLSLPILPALLTAFALWRSAAGTRSTNDVLARQWCVVTIVYLAVAVPVAFFWRGRLFKSYRIGRRVPPKTYLLGMSAVWLSLAAAGLVAAAGSLFTGTALPNLAVGVVALLVYWTLWPTGDAMVRPTGGTDDPQVYNEPR